MAEECIFCKIARKEVPSMRTYENEGAIAVLDVKPLTPGHMIVMPKKHVALVEDASNEEIAAVFSAVKHAATMIKHSEIKPDALTIGINDGKAAHQFVPHLHVHIIPRFSNDNGGSVHTIVSNPPKMELKAAYDMIMKGAEQAPAAEEEKTAAEETADRSTHGTSVRSEELPEEITRILSKVKHETPEEKRRRLEREMGL